MRYIFSAYLRSSLALCLRGLTSVHGLAFAAWFSAVVRL